MPEIQQLQKQLHHRSNKYTFHMCIDGKWFIINEILFDSLINFYPASIQTMQLREHIDKGIRTQTYTLPIRLNLN